MSDELKQEGLNLFQRGLHDEALAKFEEATASFESVGDSIGQAEMLNNIGVVHRVKQNWPEATAALTKARAIFAEVGDTNREAQTVGNLGDFYQYSGDTDKAAKAYSDSAELFARCEDAEKQSQVLRQLSLLYLRKRQMMQSIHVMDQSYKVKPSLNIFQKMFHGLIKFTMKLFRGE